jgi:signal peptidase I
VEAADPAVTWPAALRPALDVLVPAEAVSAARRVRNTAVWAAVAAWLLPSHGALGTATTAHRAWICGAFVGLAVLAHLSRRGGRWMQAFAAGCVVAGVLVRVVGGRWGPWFIAFAAAVMALTALRRRYVSFPEDWPEPDRLPPREARAPRVAAFYAWLIISILFMKEWAAQAMVVPTGSMQPTIMGGGGRSFPKAPSGSGAFSTMLFGIYSFTQFTGDHLVVENFSYLFRDPKRWEIVVFEFPLYRERYFVKRVVGLPGERVEIKDGDVWIDGKVARKPPVVQETLWRELFPMPPGAWKPKTFPEGFTGEDSEWRFVSDFERRCVPPKGKASFATYKGRDVPADVRVALTVAPEPGAWIVVRATSRGVPITLRVPTPGTDVDESGGLAVGSTPHSFGDAHQIVGPRAFASAGARVELCVADGQAWAVVDGRETPRVDVPLGKPGKTKIEIGAERAPVAFRDVRVAADIVYETGGRTAAWDVPADSFFFLGDNVKNSQDSRSWSAEIFHPPGGAPPLAARRHLISEMGADESKPNVREIAGFFEFTDVDGVPRKIPVAGTTVEHDAPAPFAKRSHLVGRAVMTFWPFFTPDAGFRPRLLP